MADKISLARLKKFGKTFEISVDPDLALQYKKGELEDIREVLHSEEVFSDAKKGLIISTNELKEAFNTDNPVEAAKIIIKDGEIQLTSDHRSKEKEQKKKKLVEMIRQQAIDPKTELPHTPTRIEAAIDEAKISIDEHKTAEEQFEEVISKLRIILPLKIEQKKMVMEIPAEHTGKCYQWVKNNSKVLKEEWKSDGSWRINVEVPAGLQQELIDKLQAMTHGNLSIENE